MKQKLITIILLFAAVTAWADEKKLDPFSIIENYSSIMREDENNWTIAHCVAAMGTAAEMEVLLETADLIDERDDFGNTPVIVATLYGNMDTFRFLIMNGCDTEAVNKRGGACVHYLGYFDEKEQGEALELINQYSDIDAPTGKGLSLLHYAVHGGRRSLVEELINYEVDINREDKVGSFRPVDMARYISFQYTDVVTVNDNDIKLENDIVALLLDNGSRYKSYIPMSIAAFGNFFFNIYVAIDSILEDGISMAEVNKGEYFSYVNVNGSENPIIALEDVGKMFGDAGIDVELQVYKEDFEQVIDDCNYSEDLYVILANLSGHPYIRNHWGLVTTRYRRGSYQNFLQVYESSSLFEPMFYRLEDVGTMISIRIKN